MSGDFLPTILISCEILKVKMKIIYIVSTLEMVGPTSQLLYICSNLEGRAVPVVVTLSPEKDRTRLEDFVKSGIRVIQLNLSRLEGLFSARRKLAQVIQHERPDILHSQGLRADGLVSSFCGKYATVSTIRNFPQLDFSMTYGSLSGRLMTFIQGRALRRITSVVGVSEAVTANLKKLFELRNVLTIRNGVDHVKFHPLSLEDKACLRDYLGLNHDAILFVTTGHITARKDPLTLINAFRKAFSCSESVELIFVGDGDLVDICKEAAGDAKIHFVGSSNEVWKYLQVSDYFVSSSLAEGMPNSVLEALATKLPVILSDISPHTELLSVGYDVGELFETSNVASLAQRLTAICGKDKAYYKEALDNFVEVELTALSMARRYLSLYKSILEPNRD